MTEVSKTHPSSVLRYCPSCGSESFLFSGVKHFTCNSCGFVYYINPAPAVAVIIESPDGRIVLTRRKHEPRAGYLDLPGGFVDIMESAEDAARREIREELGIDISPLKFIGTAPNTEYVYKGISYFTCDIGYVCTTDSIDKILPADDVSEAILVRPQDINLDEICFPSIAALLRIYLSIKSTPSH